MKHQIQLGLETFITDWDLGGARIGLVCNQASVDHNFRHAADLFQASPKIDLTALFGPQHGIRGDVQDNMIETAHAIDKATNLPIYSLYSETREPTAEMLRDVDVIVCDLIDIGCRVYTFVYTIANCMRAAARLGKKVVVCDRPNPINGMAVEGNLLDPEFASFVGQFPIPMRHGLTAGELALMFRDLFGIQCDLEIVKLKGWSREHWFDETDAPWVLPSPNMPTLDAATVFPGTVMLEGTQVSEGRGTTRPFEFVGAPYVEAEEFASYLNNCGLPGVYFRASNFLPTFQKHQGKVCGGAQLHVLDRLAFKPVLTGVAVLKAVLQFYSGEFCWKEPPYEYVFDRNPFDVINGGETMRQMLEQNAGLADFTDWWRGDEEQFRQTRNEFLLY